MPRAIDVHILCLPESAGSALYGMVDVLAATGTLWNELSGIEPGEVTLAPRLVSTTTDPFTCGNGIPVQPEFAISADLRPEILIVPELWLSPDDAVDDRYDVLKAWIRDCYEDGTTVYSACSGSVMLAAAGLLNGKSATSHWGYEDLFRDRFPRVRFDPAPSICVSDPVGRLVTAGGTSSWHDLAIHIIRRHVSPGEAVRIAKVYLMKWHSEGQLPYANKVRRVDHADNVAKRAEDWLAENYSDTDPVSGVVEALGVPERTLKRRFKVATGTTLITYSQNLRVEAAKRKLEESEDPIEEIAPAVGYENVSFFRRLFKRHVGLTPGQYRRMFRPYLEAVG